MAPIRNKKRKAGLRAGLFLVEKIIDHRLTRNGKLLYLIKWKGYSSNSNTWEPKENITAACIEEYDEREAESEFGKNTLKTEEFSENEKSSQSVSGTGTSSSLEKVKSFSVRLRATMAKYAKITYMNNSKSNSSQPQRISGSTNPTSTRQNSTSPKRARSNAVGDPIIFNRTV